MPNTPIFVTFYRDNPPSAGRNRSNAHNSAMPNHRVVALISSPVSLFDLGYVVEVFDLLRKELGDGRYDLHLATTSNEPAGVDGAAVHIAGLGGQEAFKRADILIVPGYPTEQRAEASDIDAVRECFARGATILSICTGSFLLAEAGILSGRRATTHWLYTDLFRERFPDVILDPDILYADEGQIVTAAGSAAGLDMLMHVIRVWEGSPVSNAVARRLNVAPHRDGGQAQFIPRPVPDIADDRINRLIAWMRDHCTRTINVEELASQVAMSPRNFYRHFRSVTGHTPYNWLLRERIGVAMELLEAGRLTIDRIAESSGFSSADALRTQFQRIVGVSPSDYRRMFACQGGDSKGEPAEFAPASEIRRVA